MEIGDERDFEDVRLWLDSLTAPLPLVAPKKSEPLPSPIEIIDSNPRIRGTPAAALLWLRVGRIDPAHALVQAGHSDADCYVHGIVHRLEQDYWNAKYWFGRVAQGDLLDSIGRYMTAELKRAGDLDRAIELQIVSRELFFPAHFVDACQRLTTNAAKSNLRTQALLENVGQLEWQALWDVVIKNA